MQGASAGNPGYLLYRKHNNSGLLVPFAEVKLLLIKGVTEPIVSKYGIQGVSTGSSSYQYFMLGKGIDVQHNWSFEEYMAQLTPTCTCIHSLYISGREIVQ